MATATVSIREQLGLQPFGELYEFLNILIYAEPKQGKTYLAATAEDHKDLAPVLHLGFEQGLLTVANRIAKGYSAKEIRTLDELEAVTRMLEKDQASPKPYYKTLIIDNATEFQQLDKDTIMRVTKKTARNPEKIDIDIPSPREWGKLGARLRRTVQCFRDMPINTIWTAWRGDWIEDPDGTAITHYYPKLQGHMKNELAGYFDIVGYLRIKTVNGKATRLLQVQETTTVKAGWRAKPDEVPDVLVDPNIPEIWDAIKKQKAELAKNAS